MAGKHSGVQTRIKEICKSKCRICSMYKSFLLNLACLHEASTAINSITFFGTIEQLFSLFSSSTHRRNVLLSVTGQGVKRSVETHWSARAAAVTIVKKNFFYLLSALEKLTSEEEHSKTLSDAGVLLNSMQSFSFLCYLHLWESVLLEINDAQKYLQIKRLNVHQCHIKLNSLQTHLMEQRDTLVQNAVIAAKIICEKMEISTERRVRRRKNMSGENSQDVGLSLEEEVRREMFSSMLLCFHRSFSKLKLIKNYLRSTMSQSRLQNLAILSIEQEITNNINFESIIHDFSSMKARRVDII